MRPLTELERALLRYYVEKNDGLQIFIYIEFTKAAIQAAIGHLKAMQIIVIDDQDNATVTRMGATLYRRMNVTEKWLRHFSEALTKLESIDIEQSAEKYHPLLWKAHIDSIKSQIEALQNDLEQIGTLESLR